MTAHPSAGEPRALLAATRDLTHLVRQAQSAAWFPLLVFATVTFGVIPFDRYGHRHPTHCTSTDGGVGRVCSSYSPWALWYWPVVLLLAYGVISWFYLRRSRQRGVGTQVQPFVIAGLLLVALFTAIGLWALDHPAFRTVHPDTSSATRLLYVIAGPPGAIGLALIVLARIERSWTLLAVTGGYLVTMIASSNRRFTHPSPWNFLPHVLLQGGVLLIGAVALALMQRAAARSAA